MQLPEPGDEVLVAFEQGEFSRPYVIGQLWDGKEAPPESSGDITGPTTGNKTSRFPRPYKSKGSRP